MTTTAADPAARLARLATKARTAQEDLRAAVREDVQAGRISELAAAKATGMDRMTVRRLVGKTR